MNPFARILANVGWLIALSVVIVLGAFLTFASGVFFDDSYKVSVGLPEAGGVLPLQEVTVNGRAVGQVDDVKLVEGGVKVVLKVLGEFVVPAEADIVVLRRSPIGEQAVDLRPLTADWTPAEPNAAIVANRIVVPEKVPFTLEKTQALFDAIPLEDLGTVIHEFSLAVGGRGETLKQLNRDALDLGETLVAGIPEFERGIASSESVLRALRDHRQSLANSFTSAADLGDVLVDVRPETERLLISGPRALDQLDALIRNDRANLTCIIRDLNDVNAMFTGPTDFPREYSSKLEELELGIKRAPVFFRAFDVGTQWEESTGFLWARIGLEVDQEGTGQPYEPKRPTPVTKPGAACETTAFGTGVNAVRQADAQPPAPSSPGIDYAPLVDETGGQPVVPPNGDRPLPATGGGFLLLAPLAMGLALTVTRRRG